MSETLEGRRIYIHSGSIARLAMEDPQWAEAASFALGQVRTVKIAHHHIVANGVELGAVREHVAGRIMKALYEVRDQDVADIFESTGYQPKLPYRRERRLPVLGAGERIVNTCYQDGYFTFATSDDAADRMFADREPMRQLRASIGRGAGPDDLTIISSPLFRLDADGTATDTPPIDLATARQQDLAILAVYPPTVGGLYRHIDSALTRESGDGFTTDEQWILRGMQGAMERSFAHSSF